jgi:hypothetical protein
MRNWRELVPDDFVPDCAMMLDSLEHIPMDDAVALVGDMQESFNKILLLVPIGLHIQDKDAWGYGNDFHQTHKSTWLESDVRGLGFTGKVVEDSHEAKEGESGAAMYAVWERKHD